MTILGSGKSHTATQVCFGSSEPSKVGSSLSLFLYQTQGQPMETNALSVVSFQLRLRLRQEQVPSLTRMAPDSSLGPTPLPVSARLTMTPSLFLVPSLESHVLCHSSFYLPPESTPNLRVFSLPCSYSCITACLQSKSGDMTDPLTGILLHCDCHISFPL